MNEEKKSGSAMSVLSELFSAFKFYIESKKGKYSLDTYLDIIGEYADRMILQCEKEGYAYLGGSCKVVNSTFENTYDFKIDMYFQNLNGERVAKESIRKISKARFTSETEQELQTEKLFEINRPHN